MSEQMEVYVKARREWLPVSYLGERKADGITLVVWSNGTGVEFFDDDEMKNRLRPAPRTEPEAEDGWSVSEQISRPGKWIVYHSGDESVVPRWITVNAVAKPAVDVFCEEWLHATRPLALAALAKWREQNRKFVPTPHEPVEGVTIFDSMQGRDQHGGTVEVFIDGVFAGDMNEEHGITEWATEHQASFKHAVISERYAKHTAALTAFRDRIRSDRNAKAEPKDAPRTWTRAEIISIAESVK